MADGNKKPAMSLNQLHNRFLSASQARPKQKPVDHTSALPTGKPAHALDDAPRFDFGSPSPSPPPTQGEVDVKEPVSRLNDSSPRLFAGFDDFDSRSPIYASKPPESCKTTEEEESSFKKNSATSDSVGVDLNNIQLESSKIPAEANAEEGKSLLSGVTDNSDVPREEKQKKVRMEGRRRLCKISENNEDTTGAGEKASSAQEPTVDDIWDFDSPLPVKKTCESSGNEIMDILNDLSSKLEILSIEKKRIPKKVDTMDGFQGSLKSKLHDVTIKEGFHDYKADVSSHVPHSYSQDETAGTKGAGNFTNKYQKNKTRGSDAVAESYVGKPSRNMDKYEKIMNIEPAKEHAKTGSTKEFQDYSYRNEDEDYVALSKRPPYKMDKYERPINIEPARVHAKSGSTKEFQDYSYKNEDEDYVALSKRPPYKKPDGQTKFIKVSDEESDEVTTFDNHVDEFTLSGLRGTYKLPHKIANMLYPHQREGLKWLWSLHCKGKGGILGDDMGLGKTMQICSYLCGLFHSNLIRRVLIVAPKTLLTHWINELSTVGLSEKTREYFATCQKTRHYELQYVLQDKGILLTTYDIVRNNTKSLCGDHRYNVDGEEDELTWDYMILDEGHLIKNPSTQRAKSLLQIPCRHRIIISGTPLQNNLKELWALFNFSCPELLGDKKEFKDKYEYFISRGNEKNASDREKHIGSSVAKKLRDCIQPYFLRRMKSEVFRDDASLSNKNELIVWLRLTQCQRRLYEAFLNSEIVVSACDGSPLAALTILKKICDHPLILTKRAAEDLLEGMDDSMAEQEDHKVAEKLAMHIADVADRFDIVENHNISCKISFILSLLGDLIPKGHNVLIFSQSKKMLNLIQESLTSSHYKYMRIDGDTKILDRAKVVKDFQEGRGAPIFLLTSQVGGLGLTLTNADRVIVVDPAWNPSTDNQSVDRAYRIGQKKDVIVYRLMTCGTVEEKIYRKQVFKGGLFRSATEQKEQIRYFSQQDLRDLFTVPKLGFDVSPTQQQLLEEHDREHTMEESLRGHVEFLETLNIAGVSQHSLLFSKAAPSNEVEILDVEEPKRSRGTTYMGNASTRSPLEHNVDGAQYAFNPKDVNRMRRNSVPDVTEPSEAEIKERISRLSHIFLNTAAVSRLPDKGEKIHKQINALEVQLNNLRMSKGDKVNVIELS
ncbi:protein CHROMATIN REMODELING 24 isoform X1 [Salvia hispanica]|uniref:protein CHROMATIN REMODELING 24 isoform X1 n=1 Tax=Salvia hispanica TaxID=49212 RepID=UPI002009B2B7|nr:protein CHROMATIN REMODELING 24 isoform X1 [Salvia hispanica]